MDTKCEAAAASDLFSNAVGVAREAGTDILVQGDRSALETNAAGPGAPGGLRNAELRLPLEIVDGIIGAVEDKTDLKACALSCSFFRHTCQTRLFEELTINCDYDGQAFREGGMVYTIAHDNRHAHLMDIIRWLKIRNHYGARRIPGGGKTIDSLLGKFVKKLKAVEKLEISGRGLEWQHRMFADGLVTLLQVPTLREMKLRDLQHFPMPLILWGQTLQRVEIERVAFMERVFVGFKKPPVSPSLKVLRMDNRDMGLTLLGFHFLSNGLGRSMFAGLRELRLEYRDGEDDRPDDINTLLTACQDSLEDLVLLLTHEAYALVQLYARNIRLDRMIKLQSFSTRLYITTREGYLDADHPFKLLKALFDGGPPSLHKIQLSFFHRFGDEADEGAPEASGWTELDSALTSMSGLEEVSVVVCCTQCAPEQIRAHADVYDLPLVRARGIAFDRRFTDDINSALEA